ncbi:MAG: AAA family ATPase [Bacteroidales bacterium]|nr:AAA family ATPase [Bacteroidales bacterium]
MATMAEVKTNEIPNGYDFGQSDKSLSDFEAIRITDETPIPTPEAVMKIAGETVAVESDVTTLGGAPKGGKTALAHMGIAASMTDTGTIEDGIEGLEMKPNHEKKAIIHFDTEQARHRHQYNVRTILKRSGHYSCPDYFLSYNIRKLPLSEYASTTSAICEAAARQFNGIHSIWIDGGADYIAGVNDEITANEAVKYFEELAITYNCAVFLVVHTNPGSDKERGHFGSQCQRKSGGILLIKIDAQDESSYIEAKMLRYAGKGDIPLLKFKYDKEKGYHVGIGVKTAVDQETIKKNRLIKNAYELAVSIFSGQRSYSYSDAINEIERITLKSINPCKALFSVMKSREMILQGDDKNWRFNEKYTYNL